MKTPKLLPLPDDGFGSLSWWRNAIEQAEEPRTDLLERTWRPNLDAYLGGASAAVLAKLKTDDRIPVNVDFYNTEQKKAQLFFRTPHVQLTSKQPGQDDAVLVFQAVVNHYLSPERVNAAAVMDEVLFDCLCPSGLMVSKIGYEAIQDGTVPVQVGMQPAPQPPGSVLGLQPTQMVPVFEDAPRIIHERYFWERVSPAAVIIPREFTGSVYDRAPWLAFRFVEDLEIAKQKKWVPKDFEGSGEDKYRLVLDPRISLRSKIVVGTEVWYRASRFDDTEKHPLQLRQMILIDGLDAPAVHRNSPYQRKDPQTGKITGMQGYPVHVGSLRTVSDSAFPPSDCTISRAQVDELADARTDMRKQRRRAIPMRWADRNRVDPNDIDNLKKGDIQGVLMLDGNGNEILGEVARAEYPRENFNIVNIIQQDIDKEWALGSNQQGVTEDSVRSATELQLIQSNINVRQDYERTKVLRYFVAGVEKLAALIQLFADQPDYVEILGPDNQKRLEPWDKTRIPGEFLFSAQPDSAQRVDAASDRKNTLDFVNFMAKSPVINQLELARDTAVKFGKDPSRIIQQPTPPPPDKPNVSFRFSGADLGIPEVRQILQTAGITLPAMPSPQAMEATIAQQQAQQAKLQPHGGSADRTEQLSQHHGEETGQMTGPTNAPAVN